MGWSKLQISNNSAASDSGPELRLLGNQSARVFLERDGGTHQCELIMINDEALVQTKSLLTQLSLTKADIRGVKRAAGEVGYLSGMSRCLWTSRTARPPRSSQPLLPGRLCAVQQGPQPSLFRGGFPNGLCSCLVRPAFDLVLRRIRSLKRCVRRVAAK